MTSNRALQIENVDEIRAGKAAIVRLHGHIAGPRGNGYRFVASRMVHGSRRGKITATVLTSAGRRLHTDAFRAMQSAVQTDRHVQIVFGALT